MLTPASVVVNTVYSAIISHATNENLDVIKAVLKYVNSVFYISSSPKLLNIENVILYILYLQEKLFILIEGIFCLVCHAEMNAILNKNSADVKGCTMYVALFPCNECAKLIIQSGIQEVIYCCDKYHDRPEFVASRRLLDMARVNYRQFTPKNMQITIDFKEIEGSASSV
jgi:deoxycytidylate deaminase